jgi:hypothetical protein
MANRARDWFAQAERDLEHAQHARRDLSHEWSCFACQQAAARPEALAIGCFGSYARRDSGPGSDLDLVAIVRASDRPFVERGSDWELRGLPVPAEILVYTENEWQRFQAEGGRFAQALSHESVWMIGRPPT